MPRNSHVLIAVLIGSALWAVTVTPTFGQRRNKRRIAYTELANAPADFIWQGEYSGAIFEDSIWKKIGLQVNSQGDGSFAAVEYPGGLPGSGWTQRGRVKMSGRLKNDVVWLKGKTHGFVVEGDTAMVYGAGGRPLGQISKVQRVSPTMGQYPPDGATVLFDGRHTRHFKRGKMTFDGLLKEGTETKASFRDFTLHLEFRLPYMPYARGQGRGNSGVYLQGRYEVQILDSFALDGKHNECGGLYKFRKPDVNMCLPPLSWQTYDIDFTAARFEQGKKIRNARLTVWHNGVRIHDGVELKNKTGAGAKEGPKPRPTRLQKHGNPVRFRNICIVDRSQPITIPSPQVLYATPSRWKGGDYYPLQKLRGPRPPKASWLW
ncbi:MAG: DUF1080 domain-containing protein [Planctomycetes bacterium]|nr:DUF1080 domain-containing protein [Planctomycetota bacterium]